MSACAARTGSRPRAPSTSSTSRRSTLVAGVPGVAAPAAFPGYRARFETNGIIARAGINFKFGTF